MHAKHITRLKLAMIALVLFSSSANAQFVTLDSSYIGTGQTDDMTDKIPRPLPLDARLPLDTSGWVIDTLAYPGECNEAGILSAKNAAITAGNTVVDMSLCVDTINIATGFAISKAANGVVLRGHPVTKLPVLNFTRSGTPPERGWADLMFQVGEAGIPTPIATWLWDRATTHVKGTDLVGSSQAITAVYPGDMVTTDFDPTGFSNGGANPLRRTEHWRVVCAVWSDGTVSGAGLGCDALAINTIKLNGNHQLDMTGNAYTEGPYTGHTIYHIERPNDATVTQNIAENVGLEDFTIQHAYGNAGVRAYYKAIDFHGCMECWMTGMQFPKPWGHSWFSLNAYSGDMLIEGNDFVGPVYANMCRIDITASTQGNPVGVTISRPAGCPSQYKFDSFYPYLIFPHDYPEAGLAGKITKFTCSEVIGEECVDPSTGANRDGFTVTLTDFKTGATIDGAGFATTPTSAWTMLTNEWQVGGYYWGGESSGNQFINNSMLNPRSCGIMQSGAYSSWVYGNYIVHGPEYNAMRCFFNHGSGMASSGIEANDADSPLVIVAQASNASITGIGPHFYVGRNRIRQHVETHLGNDWCALGGICNESYDQFGSASEDLVLSANTFAGFPVAGNAGKLGSCNNDNDTGTGLTAAGCEAPYQHDGLYVLGNLWRDETDVSFAESATNNPTFVRPELDAGINVNVDVAPAGWSTRSYPSSILYDTTGAAPHWWCQESGTFGASIGSDVDDFGGTLSKLPAQIRFESGTCTAVSAVQPPVMTGATFSGAIF